MINEALHHEKPNKLLILLFTMYILALPIRMLSVFDFLKVFSAASAYLDFIFWLAGLMIIALKGYKKCIVYNKKERLFNYLVFMFFLLLLIKMFMSWFLLLKVGTLAGQDPFQASFGETLFLIQYLLVIFFNKEIIKYLSFKQIYKLLWYLATALLIIGLLQVLLLLFPATIKHVYDLLNFTNILPESSRILSEGRVQLIDIEPAFAGSIISILVMPLLLAHVLFHGANPLSLLNFVLWTIVTYFTKSSTAYLLVMINFIAFAWLYLKDRKHSRLIKIIVIFFVCALSFAGVILYSLYLENSAFTYVLVHKLMDFQNTSTVSRLMPIYVNSKIFLNYPLFGVGDGNQGFFYSQYFPEWAKISTYAIQILNNDVSSIANAGSFMMGIISGYGMVGILLLGILIKKSLTAINRNKDILGPFYQFYKISGTTLLIHGFTTDFAGKFWILFVISIPFMIQSYYSSYGDIKW